MESLKELPGVPALPQGFEEETPGRNNEYRSHGLARTAAQLNTSWPRMARITRRGKLNTNGLPTAINTGLPGMALKDLLAQMDFNTVHFHLGNRCSLHL